MTELPEYNGWANYPTWAVSVWFSNDEASSHAARLVARFAYSRIVDEDDDAADLDLDDVHRRVGQRMRRVWEESAPGDASLRADLAGWAAGFIDWTAIAASFLEEE